MYSPETAVTTEYRYSQLHTLFVVPHGGSEEFKDKTLATIGPVGQAYWDGTQTDAILARVNAELQELSKSSKFTMDVYQPLEQGYDRVLAAFYAWWESAGITYHKYEKLKKKW